MNDNKNLPTLHFTSGFSEKDEYETPAKGWRGDVIVELPDGRRFPVFFYDPVRLAQEFENEDIIAEVGLIVTKNLTKENMEQAVQKVWRQKYFEGLKPI